MRHAIGRTVLVLGLGAALLAPSSGNAERRGATVDDSEAVPAGKVPKSCRYKGKQLWGKVKVVTAFPDLKVQVVNAFPDLKVKKVTAFPDKCGKWKFVKSFPDIKIKFVKSFPDIKIKYVNAFPGVP